MNDQNIKSTGKFGRWVLAAIGTLSIGLAGVWLTHLLGPKTQQIPPDNNPCANYSPPDADYIKEILDQTQKEINVSDASVEYFRESYLAGHFVEWVVNCGKTNSVYTHNINSKKIRVTPSAVYTDSNGRQCRKLMIQKKIDGKWKGSSEIACLIEGTWKLLPKNN